MGIQLLARDLDLEAAHPVSADDVLQLFPGPRAPSFLSQRRRGGGEDAVGFGHRERERGERRYVWGLTKSCRKEGAYGCCRLPYLGGV